MRVIQDLADFPNEFRGAWVALGNFDGVHRGHRAVIDNAKTNAAMHGATAGILTFEPHPRRFFRPDDPPFRLTPSPSKVARLEETGVDFAVLLTFDAALANLSAQTFLTDLLLEAMGVGHACVGTDFKFGRGRRGSVAMMEAILAKSGAGVHCVRPVLDEGGEICSSTRIRAFLQSGAPRMAATLLGSPWEIWGFVSHGDRRGRQLGFPTANIPMPDILHPKAGVYAVTARIGDCPTWIGGVANIGDRPTVGGTDFRLEAHLFDFQDDIYDRPIRVRLIDFIRPETRFDGLDALKARIAEDCVEAHRLLSANIDGC